MRSVKLALRYEGEEFPATLEVDERGLPRKVALADAAKAPLELIERCDFLSALMKDGGWPAIVSLRACSPRFAAVVERIAEAIPQTDFDETPANSSRVKTEELTP